MEFVYLAANDRLPGLVKIGHTNNVTERMTQLSSATGVIGKFECLCFCAADNAHVVEKKLHEKFASCRVDKRREFFEIDWRIVATTLTGLVASSKCDENNGRKRNSEETTSDSNEPSSDELHRMAHALLLSGLPTVILGDVELQRRGWYINYVTKVMKNTGAVNPQEKAEYYAMCLQYIAHVINVRSVYVISNVERAKTILNKLRKGGELCTNWGNRRLFPAMNFYVEFLQEKKSRYDYYLDSLQRFRDALKSWESDKLRGGGPRLLSEEQVGFFAGSARSLRDAWRDMEPVMEAVGRKEQLLEIVDKWDLDKTESWLDSIRPLLQEKRKNETIIY